MKQILLVIPAFNEESNIERVAEDLLNNHPELDFMIINDGSTDDTSRICHEKGYPIIDHAHNMGLAGAFHTGMEYAYKHGYECAVQFDGDGQHRAEFVLPMYEKMKEGYDIVIASRFIGRMKPPGMRMVGSNMIEAAIRLTTGVDIKDPTSGMRMYDRKILKIFTERLEYPPEPNTLALLIKNGARVAEIPAVMDERVSGESYLKPMVAARYMLRMLRSILITQTISRGRRC